MIIIDNFFTKIECNEVIKYCLAKEKILKEDPGNLEDLKNIKTYQCDNDQICTILYHRYNFFRDNIKYIDILKRILKKNLPYLKYPVSVQSWVNIYRNGQGIDWHDHANNTKLITKASSFAANIFIDGPTDPGIIYAIPHEYMPKYKFEKLKNVQGQIHLFPDNLKHKVSKNITDKVRYTIGMTIHEFDTSIDFKKLINMDEISYIPEILLLGDSPNYSLFYF